MPNETFVPMTNAEAGKKLVARFALKLGITLACVAAGSIIADKLNEKLDSTAS